MTDNKITFGTVFYDKHNPHCMMRTSYSQGKTYAFLQCVDTGIDGTSLGVKRYWGEIRDETPELEQNSIRLILKTGGKWPSLPITVPDNFWE